MNENPATQTPSQQLAGLITAALVDDGLMSPDAIDGFANRLSQGALKPHDWLQVLSRPDSPVEEAANGE